MADNKSAEEFREEQKGLAEAQNLTSENAVPEKRPQAFQETGPPHSELTQRLIDEGEIPDPNAPPMGKEAYDKADSDSRKKQTATEGSKPAVHVGAVIEVQSGPHKGRRAAVIRVVSYPDNATAFAKMRGIPSVSDYANPKEVEVSFRGDARDGERAILDLEDIDFGLVDKGFVGRGAVIGGVS